MNNSRVAVSAELSLGLIGPEHTIVPLMASLHYTGQDPYAIKMAFHVGTDEPVEWTLARELLAAALHARVEGTAPGPGFLNISMTSPFGHAQFEAPAAAVASFLHRTYRLVPEGEESQYIDFDAEIAELLSQA
jgi:Streptomyces sporulation and cell division protein, SsgA